MERLQIELSILLPGIPDERDHCVQRIITLLENRKGIDRVHVVHEGDPSKAHLCFHYDPGIISIDTVQQMARTAGASLTAQFGHLLVDVAGIRHIRHARYIETQLSKVKGVLDASVAGSGLISIEFDLSLTSQATILQAIRKEGLHIKQDIEQAPLSTPSAKEKGHAHKPGDVHEHGGLLGKNTELIFSILCGLLLGLGYGLSFVGGLPGWVPLIFYVASYFFGGFYVTKEALEAVVKGEFEIDFLMLVAAIGAAILGQWAEGALLLFLFSMGHALEHYAMNKARKSIEALSGLAPKTALVKKGDQTTEVAIDQLQIGDVIIVKPHTKIAADGVIVQGSSDINQAPITGESIPVEKTAIAPEGFNISKADKVDSRYRVFAGSINGNGSLEVQVSKLSNDSTIARLVKMVNEAQTQKSPTQHFTDKFEKIFVPAVLLLVLLLCFAYLVIDEPFNVSFYRAMSVLVASSPCALAISTPSAVLSGVARAARAGVLIKGGKPLEDLGTLTAMAFDKTGTLTEGKPKLTQVIGWNGFTEEELLQAVVAVEALSDHPLAAAIVRDGQARLGTKAVPAAHSLEAVQGMGIKASLENNAIFVGNLKLFENLDEVKPEAALVQAVAQLEKAGNTTMVVRMDKQYMGIIGVMDTPRPEARQTLEALKQVGIRRMIMLTGDNQQVAEAVAQQTGITDAWGSLLPEQKVEAIKKLVEDEHQVAMVGDGVNDAPAMANSTVGIAMGAAGSDVALETADIALMDDKLTLLPFAIGLSRKARSIIKQNLIISLGMVALLIPLTILGIATLGPAVMAHEGSTLVVVFNALRLLAYKQS
jgi:Cd2+/Zn2+-exporting ATPase